MSIFFHKKLFDKKHGNGLPIIFLHGFMENMNIWNKIVNVLSIEHNTILIDFPGHGKTKFVEQKNSKILTMENLSFSLEFYLKKNNINKAFFIGHSMGGYVALALAEKYPEIFLGLCLLHSTAQSDDEKKKKYRINSIPMIINHYSLFVTRSIEKLFNVNKLHCFKEEIDYITQIALCIPINCILSIMRGMLIRKNRINVIKTTTFPKLYIIGSYDSILQKKILIDESKLGYNTFYQEIPTGHMGPIENPQYIIKILQNFIYNQIL
ncbi:alpha/beta fold hydrolase [Blattabacterium cuenoti]|uniref:alpha/beta fold hydrolase n=1 Tax=Blattabacterium cuenoti TaxID=1653831 RepID=UPI00163B7449|nr:alpha/beta fold hydrolase [Blattabacterium cuenoti]